MLLKIFITFMLAVLAIPVIIVAWTILKFVYKAWSKYELVQFHRDVIGIDEPSHSNCYSGYRTSGGGVDIATGNWLPQTSLSKLSVEELMQ